MKKSSITYILLIVIVVTVIYQFSDSKLFQFFNKNNTEIDKVETQVSVDYQLKYDSLVRVVSSVSIIAVQVDSTDARLDKNHSNSYSGVDRHTLSKNNSTEKTNITKDSDNLLHVEKWQASYLNKEIDLKFDIVKDSKGVFIPKLTYKLLTPTALITTNVSNEVTTISNKHNFYIGASTNISSVGITDVTPRLIYTNNKIAFSLGHNLQGPGYNVEIGVYLKIF